MDFIIEFSYLLSLSLPLPSFLAPLLLVLPTPSPCLHVTGVLSYPFSKSPSLRSSFPSQVSQPIPACTCTPMPRT